MVEGEQLTDTPVEKRSIDQLSNEELDILLEGLRARRLVSVALYQQSVAEKRKLQEQRDKEVLARQLELGAKELERVNTALDKLETRIRRIQALKLQLGIGDNID